MYDALILRFRGEPLREFVVETAPLEVGKSPTSDIVVHDASVPDRLCRIVRHEGEPAVDFLDGHPPMPLPLGELLTLGRHHTLVRVRTEAPPLRTSGRTEPMTMQPVEVALSLLIGAGPDLRCIALDGRSLVLGSARDVDVTITDRHVSQRHCRLEPTRGGVVLRDLGSRNGCWVDGQRVALIELAPGATFRIGRTDVRIVPRGDAGDARVGGMVAASPAMLAVLSEVERMARCSLPIVIYGESGVGKEGIARSLHARGRAADGPFVALNAGGLPEGTIESELFGHERGAFTSANQTHRGVFEQADGGTLFLDEIGELPLALQARLLRVLETWEVRRVGGEESRRVRVRLVCATHRDLRLAVEEGRFREDLFYRIHQLAITVPPLRERPEDVEPLARHFVRELLDDVGARDLEPDAIDLLRQQPWQGNVRELRNVVWVAAALSPCRTISKEDIRAAILRSRGALVEHEPDVVMRVVHAHYGNVSAAARALGLPRSTVRDRIRRARSYVGSSAARVGGTTDEPNDDRSS
ncbi:MAG: sigma 54-dependent Fis family transcriptional regulator [Myxococcales bacterium]|nr:sigma 54-dependent Fis family transcriptional regulator [Myxococcales bacterium]